MLRPQVLLVRRKDGQGLLVSLGDVQLVDLLLLASRVGARIVWRWYCIVLIQIHVLCIMRIFIYLLRSIIIPYFFIMEQGYRGEFPAGGNRAMVPLGTIAIEVVVVFILF